MGLKLIGIKSTVLAYESRKLATMGLKLIVIKSTVLAYESRKLATIGLMLIFTWIKSKFLIRELRIIVTGELIL